MAKIEDLIDQVADKKLRSELAKEIKHIKRHKKFGLVFEEHIPELLRVSTLPLSEGVLVCPNGADNNELWKVNQVRPRSVVCTRTTNEGDLRKTFKRKDLVVVKRFGDAIFPALSPVSRIQCGAKEGPWHLLIEAEQNRFGPPTVMSFFIAVATG